MQNAPQESGACRPTRYIQGGIETVKQTYAEQRDEIAERRGNGNGSERHVHVAQPPAWEPPGTMSTDDGQESKTEEQECSQLPERRKRTRKQRLLVVAELALAVSAALAGVLALAEWNKHKELAKIKNIGKRGYYADDHGSRIDIEPPRHWRDRKILTTAAQSILCDQSALSLSTDPAERILLEQRIQSNREWAANMLRNAHPFTRKILGAPDGNIETLLRNQKTR